MYKSFFLIIPFLLFSCSSVRVSTDFDEEANFSLYKTYAFHQKGLDKLEVNDLDKKRLTRAIESELKERDYSRNDNTPDIIINILTSSRERTVITPDPYPWGWYPRHHVNEFTEAAIILDFVDAKTNKLVWQGQGEGLIISDISSKAERIPSAISDILKKYPPVK